MDRDRDRDRRPLDIPPEDQYGTGRGQSYRPGAAVRDRSPPPRSDSYRARSPARRNDYGDSYRGPRPRSRTPLRKDDFRRRSPSPRFRDRDRDRDVRGGGDSYRGRPRSPPPRREDLPRDDLFRKEPVRDYREERGYRDDRDSRVERDYGRDDRDRGYAARSPLPRQRERSPLPLKRGREPSPYDGRDRRSPPPAKRERLESPPRGRYNEYPPSRAHSPPPRRRFSPDTRERRLSPRRDIRPRSRSPPPRSERPDPRDVDEWRRPRSPSSQRYARQQDYYPPEENGEHSVATSRRSSPPMHPSRMQHVDDRPSRPAPRELYENREAHRARSPEPPRRAASPPPRESAYSETLDYPPVVDDRVPPPREPYRADEPPSRVPPTGPSGYRAPSVTAGPPTGPSSAAVSISAHSRTPAAPPSGPRAAGGPPRADFGAPRGRGGFRGDFSARGSFASPSFRGGSRGGAPPSYGRGGFPAPGRSESFDRESDFSGAPTAPSGAPPPGPRGSFSQASPVPFRSSSNTTATTYPRTQRFAPNGQTLPETSSINNSSSSAPTGPRASRRATEPSLDRGTHPALADLPKPIEGGQKLEPLVDRSKLTKLEEEAERLRRMIDEKEAKKRRTLREWEKLSRETEAAAFRTGVAEEALRRGEGDIYSEGAGAAF